MIKRNPDHDPVPDKPRGKIVYPTSHDHRDPAPDNDNGDDAITPAPTAGGALVSLTALQAVLNGVDTGSRSDRPMLQFKREGDGTWMYGQQRTIVQAGSNWAINPTTFQRGFICFGVDNKVVSERLGSISLPMPDVTTLPDTGFEWKEEWAVNVKCVDGTDAGAELVFKTTTVGGIQAVANLSDAVRDRLNGGQHDGKVSPIVQLEKGSYQKPEHGKIWFPVLAITDWMPLSGPEPESTPTSTPTPSTSQPRRRRVG